MHGEAGVTWQACQFSDGSIAARRMSADPCERQTRCFEGLTEFEDELGGEAVEWIRAPGDDRVAMWFEGRDRVRAHISNADSLERFGTGHPSEQCCKQCGRPTFDRLDRWQNAKGEPFCDQSCHDAHEGLFRCRDGTLIHDLKGKPQCPACGWRPKLARGPGGYEPTEEVEE